LTSVNRLLLFFPRMWEMYRWATKFLIAVMLIPSILPFAMPCAALPVGTDFSPTAPTTSQAPSSGSDSAQLMMHCHHAMAGMHHREVQGQPSDSLFADNPTIAGSESCCAGHCCCGAMTSEWAHPTSCAPALISPLVESTNIAKKIIAPSSDHSGPDSARAPPRA
jgi:hypothetical protein